MPLTTSDFPAEVQVAFFILSFLSEQWDGMSGTYQGKNWSALDTFLDIYQVDNKQIVVFFMKMYENNLIMYRAEKEENKKGKKKPSSGGKNFTHKVQG